MGASPLPGRRPGRGSGAPCVCGTWMGRRPRGPTVKTARSSPGSGRHFPGPGGRTGGGIYLEFGEKFLWPDLSAPEEEGRRFCYGLRDQVGVLWDGTVVPCCLDHEGDVPLGNLYETSLEEILSGPRAAAIYHGFSQGEAREALCRRCAFTRRFQ